MFSRAERTEKEKESANWKRLDGLAGRELQVRKSGEALLSHVKGSTRGFLQDATGLDYPAIATMDLSRRFRAVSSVENSMK